MPETEAKLIGAIEAGGTKFVCSVGFDNGKELARTTFPTRSPVETEADCHGFFDQFIERYGSYSAFGIGSFGPVCLDRQSAHYGTIQNTPKPGWKGFDYLDSMKRYNCAVSIGTDVDAAALAEFRARNIDGAAPLAYVTVGTGIGVGFANSEGPLHGVSHYELGHIPVPRHPADDFPGRCPFHADCLEGLASGPAIVDRWGDRLDRLPDEVGAKQIIAFYLANLACTITYAHMPRQIVFGGGVLKSSGLIGLIRKQLQRLLGGYLETEQLRRDLSSYIVKPVLEDVAGLAGARQLAISAASDLDEKLI